MATVFPNNLDGFTTKVDNVDAVLAAHINDVQSSVVALQQKVGVNASLISTTVDYKLRNLPTQDEVVVVENLNADYLDGANLSNDGTFASNSDVLIPTQKAIKTYADTKIPSSYLDNDGTLEENSESKVATQKAVKTYADTKVPSSYLDTDGTLSENSDSKIASQKAVKTYVDGKIDTQLFKETVVGWGMPNYNAAVGIGTGNYTAPSNGYLCMRLGPTPGRIRGNIGNIDFDFGAESGNYKEGSSAQYALKKGQVVTNLHVDRGAAWFVPCQSSI